MNGTASVALAAKEPAPRQELATSGKRMPPVGPKNGPVCELLDPAPTPPGEDEAPQKDTDDADTDEPQREPTLAWLMPSAAPETAPTTTGEAALQVEFCGPKTIPDCEMPVGAIELPLTAPGAESADGAAAAPPRFAQPAPDILVVQKPGTQLSTTDALGALEIESTKQLSAGDGKVAADAGFKDASPSPSEARLRTAVAQRLELQPSASPIRDSGATLAAAAAIRATPVAAMPTSDNIASPSIDAGQLASAMLGAPATLPVSATQQAGLDLTQDSGLHRMIDRIEHLRDAFDTRETRIRLIPDALGAIDIAVRRQGSDAAVQVHFTAAEAATRQLIADAQQRLVDLADTRGVRIERAIIDGSAGQAAGGDAQSRAPHQPSSPQPRAPAQASRDAETPPIDERIA